jgi:hypothetical protein
MASPEYFKTFFIQKHMRTHNTKSEKQQIGPIIVDFHQYQHQGYSHEQHLNQHLLCHHQQLKKTQFI